MGQLVIIRLKTKDDLGIIKINKLLKKAGIKNSFTTEQENINWCKDINTNPQSPQKHLKPITLEQLKGMFILWCTVGTLSFDVGFSRTSQAEAKKYAKFILEHEDLIEKLEGADELIERYKLSTAEEIVIKKLNYIPPAPIKLPVEERTKHDLLGGLMLCKSWGLQPFWVVFGNVDEPMFMKDRIFEDDINNNLYKDKKGYTYLLLPLLPINNEQLKFVEKVYDNAWNMGLRESFNLFIPFIYAMDIINIDKVAKDYKKFYTGEELRERFWMIFKTTSDIFPYNGPNGFMWRTDKLMFVPCGTTTPSMNVQSKCSVLSALLRAIGPEASAELMSNLTGKTYLKFEFDKDMTIGH
jgi:hypothetical protein